VNGTIKRITADRGFGFLQGDDTVDRFFHMSELKGGLTINGLTPGQRVAFDDVPSDKGPRAANIYPL